MKVNGVRKEKERLTACRFSSKRATPRKTNEVWKVIKREISWIMNLEFVEEENKRCKLRP